jgi:putative endonuclease
MSCCYLYILSSRHHRYLSIGVTIDLPSGVSSQRIQINRRLRKKRVLQKLVYVESINSIEEAVEREMHLKRVSRRQIDRLIESVNPGWDSISISELVRAGFSGHA